MNASSDANDALEVATLGGGCFWCLEAVYEELEGVVSVEPGYMGGHLANPSYEAVCTGGTGHAEVVQVRFDPAFIGYREILEVFFAIHDPTTRNRQGNDVGSQYRSVIFHHTPQQRATAEALIETLDGAGVFPAPIVTEVVPAGPFWPAEDVHRTYFRRHPEQPYCRVVIAPKLARFRARFGNRLRRPVKQV